jgi:hypothetical protein
MPDAEAYAAQMKLLADELTSARGRGLGNLNDDPIMATPLLDDLAHGHAGRGPGARVPRIEDLLRDALDAYADAEDGKRPAQAALVRSLFFDAKGVSATGTGASGRLVADARTREGLAEDPFRRLQRAHFEGFADFLLRFVTRAQADSGAEPADPSMEEDQRRRLPRRALLVALVVIMLAVAGVVIGLAVSRTPNRPHSAGSTSRPRPTTSQTSTPPRVVKFKFDNLGSTVQGGNTISVYPGASTAAADRQPNGTYNVGETVPAICVTTGRPVKSDPRFGEAPKHSDQWVRIRSLSGATQYATLTYGELIPASAQLPRC